MPSVRGRALRQGELGQATAEFALVLPVVLVAALGIVQVGLLVRDQLAVVHAAREAARSASVDPDHRHAVAAARRAVPGADVDVGPRGGVGEPIAVEVSYRARTSLPLIGALIPDPVLHARAVMRIERP
jgi:Flp pilus assembly protein TadG